MVVVVVAAEIPVVVVAGIPVVVEIPAAVGH